MKTRGLVFLYGLVVMALVVGIFLANTFIASAQAGGPSPQPTPTSVEKAPPPNLPTDTGTEKKGQPTPTPQASGVPGPTPTTVVTGSTGPAGSQGPQGIPGPPGPPPSDAQVQAVVDRVLASMDGAPAPPYAKPVLDLAVEQGFVVGYTKGGADYRWQRRATRAEVTLMVWHVWLKIQTLQKTVGSLAIRVDGLEQTAARHDNQIKGLYGETRDLRQTDQDLRGLIDWRTVALVLLLVVVGAGAALTANQN